MEVADGRIQHVLPAADVPVHPEATVIDLAGCFLLPGLMDAHVHFALTEPNGAPASA